MDAAAALMVVATMVVTIARADPITIANDRWSISIEPATLSVTSSAGEVSAGRTARTVADLKRSGGDLAWRWPEAKIDVAVHLDGPRLHVRFRADEACDLSWPILPANASRRGFIVPAFEGLYVAVDDATLGAFLSDDPLSAAGGLSMPFWGVDLGERTLTYTLDDPFHTDLAFNRADGTLGLAATHQFVTLDGTKTYGLTIELGDAGPATPALAYRRLLIERGEFVSLKQKIARNPDVAKLLGAPHIYLWGPGALARDDIRDYKAFANALGADATVGKTLLASFDDATRALVASMPTADVVDRYQQGVLVEAINAALAAKTVDARVLQAAFAEQVAPLVRWGDGVSTKMIDALQKAGIDRAWIGASDWSSLATHPAAVQKAVAAGYLIGPYDSYHSIHSTDQQTTWESAQFTQDLFERGGITRADGSTRKGFLQRGKLFSPLAARPAVEERVARLMRMFQCNSWFVDCDATGEVFDDFARGITQADDAAARLARLRWIAAAQHAVVGSEGGNAYAAPAIAFAHGMMTPVIGWGDAEMTKDKSSPYYLGPWYPADGPAVFLKRVPMKPSFAAIFSNPATRLPLYQLALGDSVIATHQWGFGSLKFDDPTGVRELLELLYDVPPLYHLNLAEFAKRKSEIARHFAFFSPIHRDAALLPMTAFEWLSDDRRVQRTTFGDGEIVLTANFGDAPSHDVPARTIVARRRDGRMTSLTCGDR